MKRIFEIQETYVNETQGYRFGDSDWFEPYTDNMGKLFRDLQKEYGRCTGKVYTDTVDGAKQVGWVFEKQMQYEDARPRYNDYGRLLKPETYLRAVWVTYRIRFEATDESAVFEAMDLFAAAA